MLERSFPRRRLLLIWVLLELIAAAQVRGPEGSTVLASWLRTLVRPITWTAGKLVETGAQLQDRFISRELILSENTRLRRENQEFRTSLLLSRHQIETLQQMHEDFGKFPGLGGRPAVILSREGNLIQLLMVGEDSVEIDDPVINAEGVVGRVFRVEGRHTWVEAITHPASAIGVRTADGRIEGLAKGQGSPRMKVQFIPNHAGISLGDILYSSGVEGVYPPGLPVAGISRIRESASPFLEVEADCLALPESRRVLRILNFGEKADE